jgi:hypothetical protein
VTTSDEAGRYDFTALSGGRYYVTVSKPGFVSLHYGQRRPWDSVRSIDLRDNEQVHEVDLALTRAAAAEGRIIDENGEAIPEATVRAFRVQLKNGERTLVDTGRKATTDDRGEYRLFGLPPGEFCISVTLDRRPAERPSTSAAGGRSGYAPMFYPGTADLNGAERISFSEGKEITELNIVVRPVRLATVGGVVTSFSGALLDGAHAALVRSGPIGGVIGVRPIGRGGLFTLPGVPPGNYVLLVRSVPLSAVTETATTGRSAALTSGTGLEFATARLTVDASDVTGLAISTLPAGSLRGQLRLNGGSFTPGKASRISVTALPAAEDSIAAGATSAVVGEDGRFRIRGITGAFVIRVGSLPPSLTLSKVSVSGADVTDLGILVRSGEDVSDVDVILTAQPSRVVGRVAQGGPGEIGTTFVVVFANDAARRALPWTRYVATTQPRPDGSFQIDGLPEGGYLAMAVADAEEATLKDPDYLSRAARFATPVVIPAEGAANLTLTIQRLPR